MASILQTGFGRHHRQNYPKRAGVNTSAKMGFVKLPVTVDGNDVVVHFPEPTDDGDQLPAATVRDLAQAAGQAYLLR